MPLLPLDIHIKTDSPRLPEDYLLTPHSWRLPLHQRMLACPTVLSVGSEVWIEATVWKVLPVVMGFRCVSIDSAGQIQLCSIHGPIKVTKVKTSLEGDSICLRGELDLPSVIDQTPYGRWVCQQFISALLGRNV